MPIRVQCNDCGKRYKLKDEARGRKFRCKECGTLITVGSKRRKKRPRVKQADDEFGLADMDLDDYGDVEPQLPRRPGSSRKSRVAEESGGSDFIVRSIGGIIFLLPALNCLRVFLELDETPEEDRFIMGVVAGVVPVLIFGMIGLYIACVGELADPKERRANRIQGAILCGCGILAVALGLGGSGVLDQGKNNGGRFFFPILMSGIFGFGVFLRGLFALLTGRKPGAMGKKGSKRS